MPELGYMAFLTGKEKDAWKADDSASAKEYQWEQIQFIEHLEWMKRLEDQGYTQFYKALGTATYGTVDSDIKYLSELPVESMLTIAALSPVRIMVIDSEGKRVGYDPTTDQEVNEIPGAMYSGQGSEPQNIIIPKAFVGVYTIEAYGIGSGSYTITVESVAPDGSTIDLETWQGSAVPDGKYTERLRLDDAGQLESSCIVGDINCDGVVDIFDVVTVSVTFGSTPLDPNWNIAADLNNDDVVDIFDIVLLANNFGETD